MGVKGVSDLKLRMAKSRLCGRPRQRPPRVRRSVHTDHDPAHPVHLPDRPCVPGTRSSAVPANFPERASGVETIPRMATPGDRVAVEADLGDQPRGHRKRATPSWSAPTRRTPADCPRRGAGECGHAPILRSLLGANWPGVEVTPSEPRTARPVPSVSHVPDWPGQDGDINLRVALPAQRRTRSGSVVLRRAS
jgi:hypothetical protein